MTIRVFHGMYNRFNIINPQISLRSVWDFTKESYPLFDKKEYEKIEPIDRLKKIMPLKFEDFLRELEDRWKSWFPIPFTLAIDEETNIAAITAVHPNDQFNRSVGYQITSGRVTREKGELINKNGSVRPPYSKTKTPKWIYNPNL